jgi:hypothetical protein
MNTTSRATEIAPLEGEVKASDVRTSHGNTQQLNKELAAGSDEGSQQPAEKMENADSKDASSAADALEQQPDMPVSEYSPKVETTSGASEDIEDKDTSKLAASDDLSQPARGDVVNPMISKNDGGSSLV